MKKHSSPKKGVFIITLLIVIGGGSLLALLEVGKHVPDGIQKTQQMEQQRA